jgi:hypothetical protein
VEPHFNDTPRFVVSKPHHSNLALRGRMQSYWGALRFWNDDEIAPNSGFPPHAHANMEIIHIGPSVPGSRLGADHPEKGVLFVRRFTPIGSFQQNGCGLRQILPQIRSAPSLIPPAFMKNSSRGLILKQVALGPRQAFSYSTSFRAYMRARAAASLTKAKPGR